jgi:hypothetical protein
MRIAVLLLGLVLGATMLYQTFLGDSTSWIGRPMGLAAAEVVVPFMALLWLIGCGLVLPLPRIAAVVFVAAALVGVTDVRDVALWVGVSLGLAGLSLLAGVNRQRAARPAAGPHPLV